MESLGRTGPVLEDLAGLGVLVAIDDFGTGHSSLARLRDLPVDGLKIDRSFLRDVPQDPTGLALVRAMVDLARTLDLDVIAEGIESAEQLDVLVELGCRYGQGFHLARPMPAAQAVELLA
jgi:EAL domain-containing protein (putative c-di-GMP-specific phosphodiesterase class I)